MLLTCLASQAMPPTLHPNLPCTLIYHACQVRANELTRLTSAGAGCACDWKSACPEASPLLPQTPCRRPPRSRCRTGRRRLHPQAPLGGCAGSWRPGPGW